MAGKRDLTYTIGADASDATSSLKGLERQVRSTMREVDDSPEDSATAGDKLAAALDQVAAGLKDDFNSAAIAAEEMGRALKAAGSAADVGDTVAELKRMGLSFDEITADADKLAVALKQLDDVKLAGVKDLDSVAPGLSSKLDDVARSADSSRSVLANMVGNSVQDLGALGGVAGSAGVAIGQMGEYMADALGDGDKLGAVLANFGKVAGPIAGISAALSVVSSIMGGIKAEEAFEAEVVERFTGALSEGKTVAQDLLDILRETGELKFETGALGGGGMLGLGSQAEDLVTVFKDLGFETDEWLQMLDDPRAAAAKFGEQMNALGTSQIGQQVLPEKAITGLTAYADAGDKARLSDERRQEVLDILGPTTEDHAAAMDAAIDAMKSAPIDSATQSYIAQGKALEEDAAAAEAAAAAQEEFAASVAEGVESLDASAVALGGFVTALDRVNKASELDFAVMALDTVDAFDSIKDALKDAEDAGTDWSKVDLSPEGVDELRGIPDELKAVTRAVSGMRGNIQTELTAAFDTGGIDAYVAKAGFFRAQIEEQFLPIFTEMTGNAETAQGMVAQLVDELGLLPEDVEVQIKLSQTEAARQTLDIFKSEIDAIADSEVRTTIKTLWSQGDTIGALEALNAYLLSQGLTPIPVDTILNPPAPLDPAAIPAPPTVTVPTVPDLSGLNTALGDAAALLGTNPLAPVPVPVSADPAGFGTDVQGLINADYDPALVPVEAKTDTAETAVETFRNKRRETAPITAVAYTANAEAEIRNMADKERKAYITAEARTANAESELNRTARDREVVLTARVVESDIARWYRLNGRTG